MNKDIKEANMFTICILLVVFILILCLIGVFYAEKSAGQEKRFCMHNTTKTQSYQKDFIQSVKTPIDYFDNADSDITPAEIVQWIKEQPKKKGKIYFYGTAKKRYAISYTTILAPEYNKYEIFEIQVGLLEESHRKPPLLVLYTIRYFNGDYEKYKYNNETDKYALQ